MDVIAVGSLFANLQYKDTIYVKQLGAKGDGITDDSTSIQNAINTTPDGGTTFFPDGKYLIKSREYISLSNAQNIIILSFVLFKIFSASLIVYGIIICEVACLRTDTSINFLLSKSLSISFSSPCELTYSSHI